MDPDRRMQELGLTLPEMPKALANYAPFVRSGGFLFIAGQGPMVGRQPKIRGKLGVDVTPEQGYDAARLATLNALGVAKAALGKLSAVKRVVRATVYVASAANFTLQPQVANGATDLLKELFGEAGLPARAAVGVNVLPFDIPVEVELQLEV